MFIRRSEDPPSTGNNNHEDAVLVDPPEEIQTHEPTIADQPLLYANAPSGPPAQDSPLSVQAQNLSDSVIPETVSSLDLNSVTNQDDFIDSENIQSDLLLTEVETRRLSTYPNTEVFPDISSSYEALGATLASENNEEEQNEDIQEDLNPTGDGAFLRPEGPAIHTIDQRHEEHDTTDQPTEFRPVSGYFKKANWPMVRVLYLAVAFALLCFGCATFPKNIFLKRLKPIRLMKAKTPATPNLRPSSESSFGEEEETESGDVGLKETPTESRDTEPSRDSTTDSFDQEPWLTVSPDKKFAVPTQAPSVGISAGGEEPLVIIPSPPGKTMVYEHRMQTAEPSKIDFEPPNQGGLWIYIFSTFFSALCWCCTSLGPKKSLFVIVGMILVGYMASYAPKGPNVKVEKPAQAKTARFKKERRSPIEGQKLNFTDFSDLLWFMHDFQRRKLKSHRGRHTSDLSIVYENLGLDCGTSYSALTMEELRVILSGFDSNTSTKNATKASLVNSLILAYHCRLKMMSKNELIALLSVHKVHVKSAMRKSEIIEFALEAGF